MLGLCRCASHTGYPVKFLKVGALAHAKPGFGPIVDGKVLKSSPLDALRERGLPVPLVMGINSDEGILAQFYGLLPDQTISWLGGDAPSVRRAYGQISNDPAT
jgi:hypothetical protein